MSLLGTVDGKERGIDHFWDKVHRLPEGGIPPGFAGPFTLHEAMQIARRVRLFHIDSAIEFRPTPSDPYEAAGVIDVDIGMGAVITGFVGGPTVEVHPAFGSELDYAGIEHVHTHGSSYVSYSLATGSGPGTPLVGMFTILYDGQVALASVGPHVFGYQASTGFYIGAGMGYSDLIIPGVVTTETEQDLVNFSVFGRRMTVYSLSADNEKYRGTTSIGPGLISPYWQYADELGIPTFDANTGLFARFDPLTGVPIVPHWM